jgi:hypothetical protein
MMMIIKGFERPILWYHFFFQVQYTWRNLGKFLGYKGMVVEGSEYLFA